MSQHLAAHDTASTPSASSTRHASQSVWSPPAPALGHHARSGSGASGMGMGAGGGDAPGGGRGGVEAGGRGLREAGRKAVVMERLRGLRGRWQQAQRHARRAVHAGPEGWGMMQRDLERKKDAPQWRVSGARARRSQRDAVQQVSPRDRARAGKRGEERESEKESEREKAGRERKRQKRQTRWDERERARACTTQKEASRPWAHLGCIDSLDWQTHTHTHTHTLSLSLSDSLD